MLESTLHLVNLTHSQKMSHKGLSEGGELGKIYWCNSMIGSFGPYDFYICSPVNADIMCASFGEP